MLVIASSSPSYNNMQILLITLLTTFATTSTTTLSTSSSSTSTTSSSTSSSSEVEELRREVEQLRAEVRRDGDNNKDDNAKVIMDWLIESVKQLNTDLRDIVIKEEDHGTQETSLQREIAETKKEMETFKHDLLKMRVSEENHYSQLEEINFDLKHFYISEVRNTPESICLKTFVKISMFSEYKSFGNQKSEKTPS